MISSDLHKKLQEAFSSIDVSQDGSIDWKELQECCQKIQVNLDDTDKEDFTKYSHCPEPHSSKQNFKEGLDFGEFTDFVRNRLRKTFEAVDTNHNGFIDQKEIEEVLQKMGLKVSRRQVGTILKTMDTDGDDRISFDEFCSFFGDVPSPSMQFVAKQWSNGEGLDFGSDVVPISIPPVEMPLSQFMIAGGVAGIASRTLTAPLEKLKIVAQTSSVSQSIKLRDSVTHIYKHEGARGFFAGNFANCVRVFPTSALVCLVYSRMIKYTPVDNTKNPNQPLWRFLSGVTAGVISTAATHPLDVVRARLTIQDKSSANTYTGILNAFKRIAAEEGVNGLYKGLRPSLLSIAPFLGLQQCSYDILKLYAVKHYSESSSTFLLCGALAGMGAQTVVHPLDVIRRRIQVERGASAQHFLSALRDLWNTGGVRSIYAGLSASYLKVIPAAASSLLVRDFLLGRLA